MKGSMVIAKLFLSVVVIISLYYVSNRVHAASTNIGPIQQYEIQAQGSFISTQKSIILYLSSLPATSLIFQHAVYNGSTTGSGGTLCTFYTTGTGSMATTPNSTPNYSGNNPGNCN
jgi:hypothetical protein